MPNPETTARELALLRRMARIASIGGWEYDPLARELYWTEQVYRIVELEPYGVTPTLESTVGMYAPEARATMARALQSALEQGEAWDLELPLITARGRRIWVRVIGEPDMIDGRCVKLAGTVEDVTAARRAREALKARNVENRRLALVAEHTSNVVLITGPDDRIQWANASFTRVTGYAAAEAIGQTPCELLCRGDDAETAGQLAGVRDKMQRGEAVRNLQVELTRKDGSRYRAEIEIRPVFDERGALANYIHIQNDVTDRRAAEQQALAAQEALALAISATGIGFFYRDLDQPEPVWDEQVYRIYGLAPDEPVPPTAERHAMVLPEDRPAFLAALEAVRAAEAPIEIEYRIRRRDGAVRWIRSRRAVIGLGPRRAARIVGALLDVTELKEAAEKQRLLTERLALASSTAGIGVWEIDLHTQQVVWNDHMYRIYGVAPDEPPPCVTESVRHWVHADDRERVAAKMIEFMRCGGSYQDEYRIVLRDGAERWIDSRAFLYRPDPDKPGRVIGVNFDITQRKAAEQRTARYAEELRAALARLELATGGSEIGIFERALDKSPGFWSAQMFGLYGEPPRDVAPTWDWLLARIEPDDHALIESQWERISRSSTYIDTEFRIRRPDGSRAWLLTRARLDPADGERPGRVVGIAIDITRRKEAESRAAQYAEWLDLTASTIGIGLWQRDLQTGHAVWTAQAKRMFGLADDAPVPTVDEYLAFVLPEDRARVAEATRSAQPPGQPLEIEYRIRRADGAVRTILSRRVVQHAPDGRPLRMLGAALDVTESREAAARLSDAQERLRLAAEAGGIASWESNLETGEAHWDEAMFDLFGLPRESAAPALDVVLSLVHPDDRAIFADAWKRMVNSTGAIKWECRIVRRDAATVHPVFVSGRGAGARIVRGEGQIVHVAFSGRADRRADGTPWRVIGVAFDVTASRRTAQQLEHALAQLRLSTEVGSIGTWQRNPDGTGRWDAMMFRLFGLQPGTTPTREQALAMVHPEDRAGTLAAWQRMLDADQAVEFEYRVVRPDGEVVSLNTRGRAERGADGRVLSVVGATIDVTARRRAEAALRSANERLALATRTAGIGVWECSLDGGGMSWDARMYALYGQPPDWIPTHAAWFACVHPDDRARVAARRFGKDATGNEGGECEYRIVRPAGDERVIAERFVYLRDADGRAARVLGTNIDITDIRHAQRERDELSDRLRLATASVGMGLWVWDVAKHVSVWDDAMYALFGVTRESFRDRTWLDAVHPDDRSRAARAVQDAIDGVAPLDTEFRVVRPDGTVRHLASRGSVERDANGVVVRMIGVNWDVTERHATEQRALELAERLKLATQAAGLAAWHIDARTRRMDADELLYRMHGVPPGPYEDLWQVLEATIAPEDLPA
ncbi:MAG: PAS domain-containing protein, partial [Burkholderiaceae bacterium]